MGSFIPPPTTALSPGDRLDRYELLCVLAQGGMGTVWLARMTGKHGFERLVALKTILPTFGHDRQFVDMFLDEARIASQIDHENVARILEIGEDRGTLYHAMELIDGESLRKLYRDIRGIGATFPLGVALRIAADMCSGLHAVHELRGQDGGPLEVVHRDVSPQNVLLTIRGTVKLIDFGVAKARQRTTEATTAGTLKGKLEYMAPEQATGGRLDRRADVYAIGAVLYELLAGEPVRNTEDGRQLLALHELITGAAYTPLPTSIPLSVRTIIDRALSRDAVDRYPSADDMRRALEQAMTALGVWSTSDDVASVLHHFSRERTTRRKEAIDAAVRAAQEKATASVHTVVAPVPAAPPSQSPSISGQVVGPRGTRVISLTPVAAPDENGTGPSMRTMQGASLSEPPPPPRSSGRVFGTVFALTVVAVLGVVVGVFVSRSGWGPTHAAGAAAPDAAALAIASSGPEPSSDPSVAVIASATAAPVATPSTTAPPAIATASTPAIATSAAPDGGPSARPSTRRVVVPPPPPPPKPKPGPAKPESGDEYGF